MDRNTNLIPFFDRAELQVPLVGDAALVLHAYCALVRGHDAEAKQLLAAGLDRYPPALDTIYKQWSWALFHRGIVLLQDGSPPHAGRGRVAHAPASFPGSVYTEQLREYLTQLDKQVVEDEALAKAPSRSLRAAAGRADRLVHGGFPDVRGWQFSQPGHCLTYGRGERTAASDAVIAIGPEAVDARSSASTTAG